MNYLRKLIKAYQRKVELSIKRDLRNLDDEGIINKML